MELLKAKDLEGNLIIVNLDELRQYERLKDANVFKLLFGINEDSQFGDFKVEETDGYINLFKDFGINRTEWNLFLNFLKYGYTPYYNEKIDGISTERAKSNVESLNNLCHIFGGLNSFDEFYKKFYEENNTELNYNPQCPKEDIKNLYNWTIIDDGHVYNLRDFACTHREEDGWSAHKIFSKDSDQVKFIYYRKLKDS
tara:strand:+ start:583 stop:1176 length:594 start_codon:yes stop_codon:yes gene_type:complete